jgi:uncharacterized protein
MTFDFHLHAAPGQDLSPLLRAMDEQGVDMGAICAVVRPGEDEEAANRGIVDHVHAHPDRLVGLACVVPTEGDAPARLQRWVLEEGLRGLKLHPSMQSFFPSEARVRPTIEAAAELGVPVLLHTGTVPIPGTRSRYDDPLEVDDLALAVPAARLVIAHGDPLGHAPGIAAKHANVYFDTTTTFARLCRLIPGIGEDTLRWMAMVSGDQGDGKVIYGSDAHALKPERIAYNLEPVRALAIAPEAKARILGGNARALLGLVP